MAEQEELIPDDVKKIIRETFLEQLKDDVAIEVYTLAGINDKFNDCAVDLVRSLASAVRQDQGVLSHGRRRAVAKAGRDPLALGADRSGQVPHALHRRPDGRRGRSLLVAIMMASSGMTILSEPVDQEACRAPREARHPGLRQPHLSLLSAAGPRGLRRGHCSGPTSSPPTPSRSTRTTTSPRASGR